MQNYIIRMTKYQMLKCDKNSQTLRYIFAKTLIVINCEFNEMKLILESEFPRTKDIVGECTAVPRCTTRVAN